MNSSRLKKLVILCGGTGGHFFPGLTIARNLVENKAGEAVLLIGGHKNKLESQRTAAEKYGIKIYETESAKLSKNPLKLLFFVFSFLKGFLKGRKLLKSISPDAVLGMGSFTSAPAAIAAVSLKIPLFLHDGNAKIGRANIFLSRWAKLTVSAFPAVNINTLKSKYEYTGMPLRPEIINIKLSREDALKKFNKIYNVEFNKDNPIILIFGGSQGAATINRVLPKAIALMDNTAIQVIHIFGFEIDTNPYSETQQNSLTLASSNEMHLLYPVADVVVSRSGGSTIAELEHFNKPAILIPYPFASDLHQNDNAEFYLKTGNAKILLNEDCTPETIKKLIEKMLLCEKQQRNSRHPQKCATDNILNSINKFL